MDMTVEQTVQDFIQRVSAYGGKLSDYFCGMTNNVKRRSKEHGIVTIIAFTECSDKETARDLMRQLKTAGFDVDSDIMSGQDDSRFVYVYKKSILSIQQLIRTVEIDFFKEGYTENAIDNLPEKNGIYACFACDKQTKDGKYQNLELKYIGMTNDGFKSRITRHKSEDHANWKKQIKETQELVYIIAELNSDILQSVEAALIYCNQPPENTEYINGYQGEYHTLTVNCKGAYATIKQNNTVTFK